MAIARLNSQKIFVLLAAALIGLPLGCLPQPQRRGVSLLAQRLRPKPFEPGPDGLFMDVIYLERPLGDTELNRDLWAAADDEVLDMDKRRALEQNGFRVAVLGGQLPAVLESLFEVDELKQTEMDSQQMIIQSGTSTQVQTSGERASWPVAATGANAAANYEFAVGVLQAVPRISSDGRVGLSVAPEIQHGDPRRFFVPNTNAGGPLDWTIRVGRQSRPFDELRFTMQLRAGQYLMLGCLPGAPESLGAHFFTRMKDGRTIQRVVLIKAEPSRQALTARGKL